MGRTRRILTLIGEHDLLKFPEALRDFKGCWVLKTFAEINFNDKFVKFVRGAYEGKIAKLLYKTKHRITVQFYTKTVLQDERVSVNPRNCVFLLDYGAEETRRRAEAYQHSLSPGDRHPSYSYLTGQLNTRSFFGYDGSGQARCLHKFLGKHFTSQDADHLKHIAKHLKCKRKLNKRTFMKIMETTFDHV